jgi:hypothetical protein
MNNKRITDFVNFFNNSRKIQKTCKMVLRKMKYVNNENKKSDFQGCFYNLVGSFGHFILKSSKDHPKMRFL